MSRLIQLVLLGAVACCGFLSAEASAAERWETSPYRVAVLVAATGLEEKATGPWEAALRGQLAAAAEGADPAGWRMNVMSMPAEVRSQLLPKLQTASATDFSGAAAAADGAETIIVLHAVWKGRTCQVRARSWDRGLELVGPLAERTAAHGRMVSLVASELVAGVFSPVAKVEWGAGDSVKLWPRAANLIGSGGSPAAIGPGAALQLLVRRADGQGGAKVVPFSYIEATSRKDGAVLGRLATGARSQVDELLKANPQWLARVVRPLGDETAVRLVAADEKSGSGAPLVGYQICDLGAKGGLRVLAVTDRTGVGRIARSETPLHHLVIVHGDARLVGLPLTPGYEPEIKIALADDSARVEAAAFVQALTDRALDVAVRRAELRERALRRAKEGDAEQAKSLAAELQKLPAREEMLKQLDQLAAKYSSGGGSSPEKLKTVVDSAKQTIVAYFVEPAPPAAPPAVVQPAVPGVGVPGLPVPGLPPVGVAPPSVPGVAFPGSGPIPSSGPPPNPTSGLPSVPFPGAVQPGGPAAGAVNPAQNPALAPVLPPNAGVQPPQQNPALQPVLPPNGAVQPPANPNAAPPAVRPRG